MKHKYVVFIFICMLQPSVALAVWTFSDVNPPGGSSTPAVFNSGIAWRPQGDYAIIAATDGLYRYDYPSGTLSYASYPGEYLYQAE